MNGKAYILILAALVGSFAAAAAAEVNTPETTIRDWPGRSRSEARVMIVKYGRPKGFDGNRLVWEKNGPWRRTIVHRKAPQNFVGYSGKDILEQSIAYPVPGDKIATLKRFDSLLNVDKKTGELSASSENENLNYLVLNLADEIIAGKRSVDEARAFYRKTSSLAESGKSSAYLDGFLFPLNAGSMPIPMKEPNPSSEP